MPASVTTRLDSRAEFRLGALRVEPAADLLHRDGSQVHLQPQVTRLLLYLAERAGEVVGRDEILERVWDDRFVSDAALTTAVWELRTALGDDARAPSYLETIPKRGYRLLVQPEPPDPGAMDPEAMDPEPSHREPAETKPRLRRGQLAAVLAVGAAAVIALWVVDPLARPEASTLDTLRTLAVLPIDNLSGEVAEDYLAAGLTDTLITELGRFPELRVTSRTSVMDYRGERPPVPEIARQLGVAGVIEGAVVRSGDRLRLTVQLIDGRSDHHLWAESFERRVDDVIALQNELARAVAGEIKLQMTTGEEPPDARVRPSPAVDDYLRGLALLFDEPYDTEGGIAALEAAVAADPGFAPARAHLAIAYVWAAWDYIRSPHSIFERAREEARTALELDPTLSRAHFALANVSDLYDWDWRAAEDSYRLAVRYDPSDAIARRTFAQSLAEHGRFDEALAEAEAARACDPLNPASPRTLGWIHYLARKTPEALRLYRQAAAMAAPRKGLRRELALILAENGDTAAAVAELETLDAEQPGHPGTLALLAMVRARAGDHQGARADLERLLALDGSVAPSPVAVAKIYAWLGDPDTAFTWLERGFTERVSTLGQLGVNPQFDPLRGDPRLADLLNRIGLEPPEPSPASASSG